MHKSVKDQTSHEDLSKKTVIHYTRGFALEQPENKVDPSTQLKQEPKECGRSTCSLSDRSVPVPKQLAKLWIQKLLSNVACFGSRGKTGLKTSLKWMRSVLIILAENC